MRRPRRNHTAAFKATVALATYVDGSQITQWKSQLLDGAIGVLEVAGHEEAWNGPGSDRQGACRPRSGNSRWKSAFRHYRGCYLPDVLDDGERPRTEAYYGATASETQNALFLEEGVGIEPGVDDFAGR